jgi:TPR repeat protein
VQWEEDNEKYDEAVTLYDTESYAEAIPTFETLAEQGNVDAQYALGICYDNGKGVEKDHAKAWEWFQKSANTKGT